MQSDDKIIAGAETIDLQGANACGILLLHGFGDTPQTFDLLARYLWSAGFGVRVPLLPGHGRSVHAFARSRRREWISFARDELADFRQRYRTLGIAGLSMGGAIAAILAADNPDVSALALISPYLGMPLTYRAAAATSWLWGPIAGIANSRSPGSIRDPAERAKNLGYGAYTGRLLYELWKVARRARIILPQVKVPTLLVQSREDPRIATSIAEQAFDALGADDKRLVLTEGSGHIITVDYGREQVFQEVRDWLEVHMQLQMATA